MKNREWRRNARTWAYGVNDHGTCNAWSVCVTWDHGCETHSRSDHSVVRIDLERQTAEYLVEPYWYDLITKARCYHKSYLRFKYREAMSKMMAWFEIGLAPPQHLIDQIYDARLDLDREQVQVPETY